MLSHHHQAIARAMDLESLHAWKVFSLAFWEEPDHGLDSERQGELFHAGFLRSRWSLYDLQEHGVESYLSDYQALCLQTVNAKYQTVLTDPVLCGHVMANYFQVPEDGEGAMAAHPALAEMADEHLLHVLLVRDPQEWQPELAAITLVLSCRCPRHGRLVQRVEEGALSASIDPSTGLITGCRLLDNAGQLERVIRHPDSGANLLGQRLPAWEQARDALLRFFDESSYLRHCHLTFVITEQGLSFVAAEADQLAAHQMHQPLLDNASIDHYLKRLTD
ncbi:sugar-transfer associated ATP-grasp domain-containing protein [Halomonas mongoliensis]|uniref:sugar-transfer associated ATP-grasp domain-containing protein n=1 Tax=Halomonas mongoliensis TaxID=321265 RepID=UPI00403B2DDA